MQYIQIVLDVWLLHCWMHPRPLTSDIRMEPSLSPSGVLSSLPISLKLLLVQKYWGEVYIESLVNKCCVLQPQYLHPNLLFTLACIPSGSSPCSAGDTDPTSSSRRGRWLSANQWGHCLPWHVIGSSPYVTGPGPIRIRPGTSVETGKREKHGPLSVWLGSGGRKVWDA